MLNILKLLFCNYFFKQDKTVKITFELCNCEKNYYNTWGGGGGGGDDDMKTARYYAFGPVFHFVRFGTRIFI